MNIFDLATGVGVVAGAVLGYQIAAPHGVASGLIAAVIGVAAGRVFGPILGLIALAPFVAVAWLRRRIKKGR